MKADIVRMALTRGSRAAGTSAFAPTMAGGGQHFRRVSRGRRAAGDTGCRHGLTSIEPALNRVPGRAPCTALALVRITLSDGCPSERARVRDIGIAEVPTPGRAGASGCLPLGQHQALALTTGLPGA